MIYPDLVVFALKMSKLYCSSLCEIESDQIDRDRSRVPTIGEGKECARARSLHFSTSTLLAQLGVVKLYKEKPGKKR